VKKSIFRGKVILNADPAPSCTRKGKEDTSVSSTHHVPASAGSSGAPVWIFLMLAVRGRGGWGAEEVSYLGTQNSWHSGKKRYVLFKTRTITIGIRPLRYCWRIKVIGW
jgi:hypothetical protein